jgi:hypothetical protein
MKFEARATCRKSLPIITNDVQPEQYFKTVNQVREHPETGLKSFAMTAYLLHISHYPNYRHRS